MSETELEPRVRRFNVESSRTAFEVQLLKELAPLGQTEEELREEYLARDPNLLSDYAHLDTQIEWTGWQRGIQEGYELWGCK